MRLPVEFDDIRAAAVRLAGQAHRTPVLRSRTADELTGAELFFKCENLQRTGSFKFRGAFNAVASLGEAERRAGVIAFSSGNHAQAVALAARLHGVAATLVMPQDAPPAKLAATRGYGATVVSYDRYAQDREALARELAQRNGLSLIPPYDRTEVMAGQGTAALELLEETGPLDLLLVCVGGGGLISGCATAARALAPGCRIVGVEPAAGNDVQQSLAQGRRVKIAVPQTIADGAQTQSPGELTFSVIRHRVDAVATVSDEALVRSLRFFATRMKIVVEPTGCLAAAAALEGIVPVKGQRVGILVSGGNADPHRYGQWLAQEES